MSAGQSQMAISEVSGGGGGLVTENVDAWELSSQISYLTCQCFIYSFHTISLLQLIVECHEELIVFPQKRNPLAAIFLNDDI